MFDERGGTVAKAEVISPQTEYGRCIQILSKTGIATLLPHSETLGVLGVDGREYPVPTPDQVQEVFDRNKDLVQLKKEQGFTRLQLTPLAAPISRLAQAVGGAIQKHTQEGKIFQTKKNTTDPDVAVNVDLNQPVWMWDEWKQAEGGKLIYFPSSFSRDNPKGLKKAEAITSKSICGTPGWSVELIEDNAFLPGGGQGKQIGGRKQLENNLTPNDYLKALSSGSYKGETGWTIEDFLINFLNRLEETNQISHDWDDRNALWLVANWLPDQASLPVGYWDRGSRQMRVVGDVADYQSPVWGVRSTVRLGT